jgi:hypothetical protein
MNKKIKNLFLAGALVLGFAGVAVSCTDYDKDINDLQTKIGNVENTLSTLQTNVNSLQSAINAGAVITSVTPLTGENGGWKFTLSDGKSYDVTNGAAGAAGKDGKFYVPNAETGCWDLHEFVDGKEVVTDTKQKYLPENGATITYDAEKNVLVVKQGEETVEVNLSGSGETSLVFIPEVYIDGVEGTLSSTLKYTPIKVKNQDKEGEIWEKVVDDKNKVVEKKVNLPIEVQYNVNLSNCELDSTFKYEFIYKDVPYLKTRTASSKDFSMTPSFKSYENGVLTLSVVTTGQEATGNDITRFALKVSNDAFAVVSDYATIFTDNMKDLVIADPKKVSKEVKNIEDEHYRRGINGIAKADSEDKYRPTQLVWSKGAADLDAVRATCDTAVVYTGTLDLKTITAIHYTSIAAQPKEGDTGTEVEMLASIAERLGLKFEYEVVKNYKIGTPQTDQAEFVVEDQIKSEGIFQPRVFTTDGTAAIGRTPIIRVKLSLGSDVIAVAYIKVFIAKSTDGPEFTLIPVNKKNENVFTFKCTGDTLRTTVKDMNEILYNGTELSKNAFHELYSDLKAIDKYPIGTVKDIVVDEGEGTHVIEWFVPADSLWKYAGKDVEIVARYFSPAQEKNGVYVDVKLSASVEDVAKTFALSSEKGDYIANYWTSDFTATNYNVTTPALSDTLEADAAKCVFNSDINASFITYPQGHAKAGMLKVSEALTDVKYFFCSTKDEGVQTIKKIGDLNVKFEVKAEGTELWASILNADDPTKVDVASELVATIKNEKTTRGDATVWNMFVYEKGKTVADTLLNTGAMFTYIGAKATLCGGTAAAKEIPVSFDGKDHFRANVVRPVTITSESKGSFIDAVDFGEAGSYIKIEDLLDPKDWRGRLFSEWGGILHQGYWNFYGPFVVKIDTKTAESNLISGGDTYAPLPATIILNQTKEGATTTTDPVTGGTITLPENKAGYLTYKNNNTVVTADFKIRVKAKVQYGFGYIDTDWIYIPVAKTIGQ